MAPSTSVFKSFNSVVSLQPDVDCDSIMHWPIWCSVLIVVLLLAVQYGDGKLGRAAK